jgi:hypothetical protein
MTNEDFLPYNEARLREKQYKCLHSRFRCPECELSKDNLYNEHQETISLLLDILQECIDTKSFPHPDKLQPFKDSIIRNERIDKLRKRYSHGSTNA